MQRKFYFLAATAALFFTTSCNNDKDMREAKVIDTGDITFEGCGYVLQLPNSELIKPIYLPSAYQHNGISVKVKYKHSGVLDTCKFGTVIYDMVSIQEIKLNQD